MAALVRCAGASRHVPGHRPQRSQGRRRPVGRLGGRRGRGCHECRIATALHALALWVSSAEPMGRPLANPCPRVCACGLHHRSAPAEASTAVASGSILVLPPERSDSPSVRAMVCRHRVTPSATCHCYPRFPPVTLMYLDTGTDRQEVGAAPTVWPVELRLGMRGVAGGRRAGIGRPIRLAAAHRDAGGRRRGTP